MTESPGAGVDRDVPAEKALEDSRAHAAVNRRVRSWVSSSLDDRLVARREALPARSAATTSKAQRWPAQHQVL